MTSTHYFSTNVPKASHRLASCEALAVSFN